MLPLEHDDFLRLAKYIKTGYGIDLTQKKHLISGRLGTVISQMGFRSFKEYIDHIINVQNPADLEILLNKLSTNYTYFMRERAHFDYFAQTVLPWLEQTRTNKVLSVWSAGCSFGHEPYTLSMILKDHFGNKPGWDTRVLATDISQNALANARQGIYSSDSLKDISDDWRRKHFRRTDNPNHFTIAPDVKSNVIFRTFNLMDPIKFKLKFDVIFCRNVMIYFDKPVKDALIKRFYDATNPGGYLFIGHSEGLSDNTCGYKYIIPSAYRK